MRHNNFKKYTTNGGFFIVVKNDLAISMVQLLIRFSIITKNFDQSS